MDTILDGVRRRHTFFGTADEVYVDRWEDEVFAVIRLQVTDGKDAGDSYPIALCIPIDAAFAMARDLTDAFRDFRERDAGRSAGGSASDQPSRPPP